MHRRGLRWLSDERLGRRVARGDSDAFAVLYERYRRPVSRYCLAILRDVDDADDAFQATMLNAFRSLSQGSWTAPVRPLLYRIAQNESLSIARRRRSDTVLREDDRSAGSASDAVFARERLAALLEDLSRVPDRQRAALVMRELQGLGYEEISLALETTPAAARQAVFAARASLAEMERGRDLDCEAVCERLSDGDGRAMRARALRSHLRSCERCRAFRRSIQSRRGQLAILPFPLLGAAQPLEGVAGDLAFASLADLLENAVEDVGPAILKEAAVGIAALSLGFGVALAAGDTSRDRPAPGGETKAVLAGEPERGPEKHEGMGRPWWVPGPPPWAGGERDELSHP
jgi:RNA polymerase sigma factor (sigma-70 family)